MISNTYAIIDLDNINHNYNEIKKFVNKGKEHVMVMPIIKANAYGHGAISIAKFLCDNGCEYIGVSNLEEASKLRENNIKTRILVLSEVDFEYIGYVAKNNITISLFSYEYGKKISKICEALGTTCNVHIKIDTGMNRVGIPYKDAFEVVTKVSKLKNINIEGIYTHFATADEMDKTFTLKQYKRFSKILDKLEKVGLSFKYKHCCNSAGIFYDEEFTMHLNMVRPGLALYGYYPSNNIDKKIIDLKPSMSLHSKVIKITEIQKGDGVSYGLTYIAKERKKIATIGVGYGDGFPRGLSNIGFVDINGKRAKIIGRVCMDKTMVDITNFADEVSVNDEVTIFGNCISVEEVANLVNTINYEIITRIQNRVTRFYKINGEYHKDTISYY